MIWARIEHIHRRTSGALDKATTLRKNLQAAGVGAQGRRVSQYAPSTKNRADEVVEPTPFVHKVERRNEWIGTAHDLLKVRCSVHNRQTRSAL
eukprot:SAG31_NODE_5046_length_2778_cov_4.430758_2_plen_93_part_00